MGSAVSFVLCIVLVTFNGSEFDECMQRLPMEDVANNDLCGLNRRSVRMQLSSADNTATFSANFACIDTTEINFNEIPTAEQINLLTGTRLVSFTDESQCSEGSEGLFVNCGANTENPTSPVVVDVTICCEDNLSGVSLSTNGFALSSTKPDIVATASSDADQIYFIVRDQDMLSFTETPPQYCSMDGDSFSCQPDAGSFQVEAYVLFDQTTS